jgi:ribosomal-protein-alanine N-acetyltransferase
MDDRKEAPHDRRSDDDASGKPSAENHLPVQIRWLIRRDMPEVLRVENTKFEHTWSEDDFLNALRQRNCIGMVAEDKGKIVGHMLYELHSDRLRLLNFVVDPEYRQRGVGRQMMDRLIEKLSQQRRHSVDLVVEERNVDAQKFLKACGFKATGVERGYFGDTGDDGYHMRFSVGREKAIAPGHFAGQPRFTDEDFEPRER